MSKHSLVYNGGSGAGLTACTDSDWGSDPTSCLSQTGFYLKLADGLINWTSHVQKTIAYLSTEAEYMALSDCTCQVTWIQNLLGELSYKLNAIPICGDNQGSIFMASNNTLIFATMVSVSQLQMVKSNYSLLMVLKIPLICSPRTYPARNSQSSELNWAYSFPLAALSALFTEVLYMQHSEGEC